MSNVLPKSRPDYRTRLFEVLLARKRRNPLYSMRAFAKELGLSPQLLTQYFEMKQDLPREALAAIAAKMFSPPPLPSPAVQPAGQPGVQEEFSLFDERPFDLLSDWYYLAITQLAKLDTARADPRWLADRLGISIFQAKHAVRELVKLGLVAERKGRLYWTGRRTKLRPETTKGVLKKYHAALLGKALEKLRDPNDIPTGESRSLTMAVDSKRIDEAKRRVSAFSRKLGKFLQAGKPDAVYAFTLQLFPLTRTKKKGR